MNWGSVIKRFYLLRFVLAGLTILLLVLYNYIPEKRFDLYPHHDNALWLFDDVSLNQGTSDASWVSDSKQRFKCELIEQTSARTCGLTIKRFRENADVYYGITDFSQFKTLDFSAYNSFEVNIQYEGDAPRLRVFLRAARYPVEELVDANSSTFIYAYIDREEFNRPLKIDKNDFVVADWWIEQYRLKRQDARPVYDRILEVAVDVPADAPMGDHYVTVKSIAAVGEWISKELFYFTILNLWLTLILAEAAIRYFHLNSNYRAKQDQIIQLKDGYDELKSKIRKDPLTQVLNRAGLEAIIEKLENHNNNQAIGLFVLDIDYFKQINDTYGHSGGDYILKKFTAIISESLRRNDVIARWGGEEFVVLTTENSKDGLKEIDRRFREAVERAEFTTPEHSTKKSVTFSCGATIWTKNRSFDQSFKLADEALYSAKNSGRNRTNYLF